MEKTQIRYKGVFDWGGLYRLIRKWFDDHKYFYLEPKYKDKVSTPFGNELEIKMRPYRKVTEFIKYNMEIDIKIWDFKEFEVEIDGEKRLVTDGRIVIWMRGWLELDYANRFNTPFEKKLVDMLYKVLKKYFELKHIDNITFSLYELQSDIKKYLNMETTHYAYKGFPG